MSRTGGFGATVLLREELLRELFSDTESLFLPTTGLAGLPTVFPDRVRSFNLPQAIRLICGLPAATPPGIQLTTFRRTAPLSPGSLRLETFGGDPAVHIAFSCALTDDVTTMPDADLTTLPAGSVFFDLDMSLRAFPESAPLLAPGRGRPYFRPPPGDAYSEDFRRPSRIFWEDDFGTKQILIGNC